MSELRAEEIKQAFVLFDPQNTGKIEPRTLGDDDLKATIRIPTHPLDFKQFTSLLTRYNDDQHKDAEEPYRRAFYSINKDGSGHVSVQELKTALDSFLGLNTLSEADVDEIITEGDVSGDGRITLEEFLKIMDKSEKRHRGEHVL
ncbi:hypothetical protein BGZ76_011264 [Entomortierella beljakovae]|nr:hypothetical protein BGZ76_011264 [Entomortierella beljakovae]